MAMVLAIAYTPNIGLMKFGSAVSVGPSTTTYLVCHDLTPITTLAGVAPLWITEPDGGVSLARYLERHIRNLVGNDARLLLSELGGDDAEPDILMGTYLSSIGIRVIHNGRGYFLEYPITPPESNQEIIPLRDGVYRAYTLNQDREPANEQLIQKFIAQYYVLLPRLRRDTRPGRREIELLNCMLCGNPPVDLLIRMIHEYMHDASTWILPLSAGPAFARGVLHHKDLLGIKLLLTSVSKAGKSIKDIYRKLADMLPDSTIPGQSCVTPQVMEIVSAVSAAVPQSDEAKAALDDLKRAVADAMHGKDELLRLASLSSSNEDDRKALQEAIHKLLHPRYKARVDEAEEQAIEHLRSRE